MFAIFYSLFTFTGSFNTNFNLLYNVNNRFLSHKISNFSLCTNHDTNYGSLKGAVSSLYQTNNLNDEAISYVQDYYLVYLFFLIINLLKITIVKKRNMLLILTCFILQIAVVSVVVRDSDNVICGESQLECCSKSAFFLNESIAICNKITAKNLDTDLKFYMLSNLILNDKKQWKVLRFLLILSGDISLNPGPPIDLTASNESWKVFSKRGFHMVHVNINSLFPKIDEIRAIADTTKASVIGITESKLDSTITDAEVSIDGYNHIRNDRNRHGGGVACYIREDICYNTHSSLSKDIEGIMFDVLSPKTKPFTVGVFYRPPDQNDFLNLITTHFSELDFDASEFYFLGDFNINTLQNGRNILRIKKSVPKNEQFSGLQKQYIEFCSAFGLKQVIVEPTRITCGTSTLIDHILTNCAVKISQSGVIEVGLSDHQMIFCTRKIWRMKYNTHKQIKFRSFKNYTKEQYGNLLRDTYFPNYESYTDIDLAYSDFLDRLTSVINLISPIKEARIKCNSQEWFDCEIAEKMSTRDKLFKKFKKSKLQVDRDMWKEARNVLQNLIKN